MKLNNLNGRNCLITGSTRGIGREIAYAMANSGCNLLLTGRDNFEINEIK